MNLHYFQHGNDSNDYTFTLPETTTIDEVELDIDIYEVGFRIGALNNDGTVTYTHTDETTQVNVLEGQDNTDIENMFEFAVERFGRIDVVFNNAGVGGAVGPLTETSVESWDYTMDVIAKGVFLGIKHGAKQMQKQESGGSIINTASIAALSGDGGPLVYSAGKAAVVSLTKAAAVELAPDKIRVNAICPGFIATPLADGGRPEQTRENFSKSQPWPEYGDSHHIASTALFLASDESSFITGESIVVDGGLTAAGPELSKKFPRTSGRNSKVTGVTKGSTGEAPEIIRLD